MTGDFSEWAAAPTNWSLALIVTLTCFGFYASRAGQPLFGARCRTEQIPHPRPKSQEDTSIRRFVNHQ